MRHEDDAFSTKSQLSARTAGTYHGIASGVGKCVFCDLKDKYIITEREGLVLTVNIFPYIDGQLVVVPIRHIESILEVTEQEWLTNLFLSQLAINLLKDQLGIEGSWLVLREGPTGPKSGKTVSHLHWNIMPYKEGINTWHYQNITLAPIDLAKMLRESLPNERN